MGIGNLAPRIQANTHDTPDTDAAAAALHHTLGTAAAQAAAGNHSHGSAPWTGQVVKSADETRSNTIAPTPDAELKFTAQANGLYLVELMAVIYADNNGVVNGAINADFRWRFDVAGLLRSQIAANGYTMGRTSAGVGTLVVGGSVRDNAHYPNQDQGQEMTHQEVSSFFFRGLYPILGAGDVSFSWAQLAANLAQVTVKAGSVLRWQKVS